MQRHISDAGGVGGFWKHSEGFLGMFDKFKPEATDLGKFLQEVMRDSGNAGDTIWSSLVFSKLNEGWFRPWKANLQNTASQGLGDELNSKVID
mmetsp:Transcript_63770/g.126145  ORF Transcript_63770/g.126145 Transcript_63770/m.126145 type:complete len:93 (-) Transcript_63770:317-595(-)